MITKFCKCGKENPYHDDYCCWCAKPYKQTMSRHTLFAIVILGLMLIALIGAIR